MLWRKTMFYESQHALAADYFLSAQNLDQN